MTFQLYNTATHRIEPFVPLIEGKVSIYHCGMTVQSAPHLGHIRKEVVFDVLRRWLEHSGYEVTIVANVTDIDDKILAKSAERGVPWWAHAYEFENELHRAYSLLGCRPPSYEPRATGHIPEMIDLIGELLDTGHAYVAPDGSGDVYFDVRSWPRYGELSGMKVDEMAPATDSDPRGKRDPRDFALWKGHKPSEPETASWNAPWGAGRPGWHLECSAMSGKYLGEAFDIHGGGIDLRFPHHENELAQSAAAGRAFAHYWMHNAWVTMSGEKMSKSLGNTARVSEVTASHDPRAVRYFLLAPHYRSTIEFSPSDEHTQGSLDEADKAIARIDGFLERAGQVCDRAGIDPANLPTDAQVPELDERFTRAMDDDLGTPAAVATLFTTINEGNKAIDASDAPAVAAHLGQLRVMLGVLGLDPDDPVWASSRSTQSDKLEPVVDGLVQAMLTQRSEARARKDWATADSIRDVLTHLGLVIEDTPDGARWSLD
ncbi:MAG: cysteine--tRNA ligase [Cutibacterium granulosum]|uniref:cysteine--tRNA ligase n=1 Tax=Cutibacterium granulosum TaxID=33011 RepID=UPI00290D6955|nr:cysteine--tRNA ligase [Cutibacterium granulosum]MDU3821898.1 cysteine--tRNA ligase [Cutibacterium granulosum]